MLCGGWRCAIHLWHTLLPDFFQKKREYRSGFLFVLLHLECESSFFSFFITRDVSHTHWDTHAHLHIRRARRRVSISFHLGPPLSLSCPPFFSLFSSVTLSPAYKYTALSLEREMGGLEFMVQLDLIYRRTLRGNGRERLKQTRWEIIIGHRIQSSRRAPPSLSLECGMRARALASCPHSVVINRSRSESKIALSLRWIEKNFWRKMMRCS